MENHALPEPKGVPKDVSAVTDAEFEDAEVDFDEGIENTKWATAEDNPKNKELEGE